MDISDLYYSGTITNLLKYNKSGFITDVFGRNIYFNSDKIVPSGIKLRIGMTVIFKIKEKYDTKAERYNLYATDIEIISSQ